MSRAQRGAVGIVVLELEGAESEVRKVRKRGGEPQRLGTAVLRLASGAARLDEGAPGMDEMGAGRLDTGEDRAAHVAQADHDQSHHDALLQPSERSLPTRRSRKPAAHVPLSGRAPEG